MTGCRSKTTTIAFVVAFEVEFCLTVVVSGVTRTFKITCVEFMSTVYRRISCVASRNVHYRDVRALLITVCISSLRYRVASARYD
jgi:hypothetical protein